MKLEEEIKKREYQLEQIDKFLQNAPEGYLGIQKKGEKYYYYHMYEDVKTGKEKRVYIKRQNQELAQLLATKGYYLQIRRAIAENLIALKMAEESFDPEKEYMAFNELHEGKKNLVEALSLSPEEKVQKWINDRYEQNAKYEEGLKFQTEQGDKVRSKSEVMIANLLYSKKGLIYKYEKPLVLLYNSNAYTIYPDYTIMDTKTGKIIYWEHVGMLDDTRYAAEFVWKVNLYVENDLLPGRDVIFTYETKECPFNYVFAKKIIQENFGC